MDIKEFKNKVKKLELNLFKNISELVKKFEKETNYTPKKINVIMANMSNTKSVPKYKVCDVIIDIEL